MATDNIAGVKWLFVNGGMPFGAKRFRSRFLQICKNFIPIFTDMERFSEKPKIFIEKTLIML